MMEYATKGQFQSPSDIAISSLSDKRNALHESDFSSSLAMSCCENDGQCTIGNKGLEISIRAQEKFANEL